MNIFSGIGRPNLKEGGSLITTAPRRSRRSNVARSCFSCRQGHVTILDKNVLLAGESNYNTPCRLGFDIADQRGLAGADCSLLFRAISTPFQNELVCINDRVQLTRKAQANQHTNGIFERLRKHRDLLARQLDANTTASARDCGHPRQRRIDILEDFGRFSEAGERVSRGRKRIVAFICLLACSKSRLVYGASPVLRPNVEKFQCIFQAGDFLNEMVPVFHKHGFFKHFVAHQSLQYQRASGFLKWPNRIAEKASTNMLFKLHNFKIGAPS